VLLLVYVLFYIVVVVVVVVGGGGGGGGCVFKTRQFLSYLIQQFYSLELTLH
jgi:hypothetical protein